MSKKSTAPCKEYALVPLSLVKHLVKLSRTCLDDASCLGSWVEGLEYELRNYISRNAYFTLNGFSEALIQDLNYLHKICKNMDLFLDLQE